MGLCIVVEYSLHVFTLCTSENQKTIYILLDYYRASENGLKESVNYQVISPKDLAKSVFSEAGWSNFLVYYTIFHDWFPTMYFVVLSPPSTFMEKGIFFSLFIYASFASILFTLFLSLLLLSVFNFCLFWIVQRKETS